jgi:predicted ATPase
MNEQLIVKNFGPIKDATVDFKRVTVFIGPTGGGKSTLAKLAMMFRGGIKDYEDTGWDTVNFYSNNRLTSFASDRSELDWHRKGSGHSRIVGMGQERVNPVTITPGEASFPEVQNDILLDDLLASLFNSNPEFLSKNFPNADSNQLNRIKQDLILKTRQGVLESFAEMTRISKVTYFPAERVFVPAIGYSWSGLLRDDIGLPKDILDFANGFSVSRKEISELIISFLNVTYLHRDGQDFIQPFQSETLFRLYETASGIQSVTSLLVLLEHLSRNTEQAQSFIIEEPELNLYPTAQQGLLNWLVEKCTQGENDLTITTHSPYILSHLNLLLYAHHVGNKDEEKRRKVAAIIPEKYWVNPDEFAAYYVNGPEGAGGVRSLLDPETKLISQNELDAVSGIQADEFDQLLDINRGF